MCLNVWAIHLELRTPVVDVGKFLAGDVFFVFGITTLDLAIDRWITQAIGKQVESRWCPV